MRIYEQAVLARADVLNANVNPFVPSMAESSPPPEPQFTQWADPPPFFTSQMSEGTPDYQLTGARGHLSYIHGGSIKCNVM